MDHGPGRLTEAQRQRLLDLFGSELRAAVACRDRRCGGDADAALGEYLEARRAALEWSAASGAASGAGAESGVDQDAEPDPDPEPEADPDPDPEPEAVGS